MKKQFKQIALSVIIGLTLWYLTYTVLGGGLIGGGVGILVVVIFHRWMIAPILSQIN